MIFIKALLLYASEHLLRVFWLLPLKKDQVLFISYGGKQFSGSPKALFKLYQAEGNPLDLAKARALGDTLVNVQKADGSIRTQMLMRPDADNFWINCMGASIRALDLLAETK